MNDGSLLAILIEFVKSKTRGIVSHNGVHITEVGEILLQQIKCSFRRD